MRKVPLSQRRRQAKRGRRSACSVALAIGLSGCIFELAPLEIEGGLGGGAGGFGTGGTFSGSGGEFPGGSGNGGAGGTPIDPCGPGQTSCGGTCQPISLANGCGDGSCSPCPSLSNANVICDPDARQCRFDGCQEGFADCDGDSIGDVGTIAGNGCEYSFGTIAPSTDPLVVPFASILVDDNRNDWNGIAAYAIEETCRDAFMEGRECADQQMPDIVAQNTLPPATDLKAYFRVAWSLDVFYVLVEAFDEHIFINVPDAVDDGRCYQEGTTAQCDDAFSVFFDGRDSGGQFTNNEDHRIFLGVSGGFSTISQGSPPGGAVVHRLLPSPGPHCYRIEASFDWGYIVGTQGQAIDGKFPPLAGQTYGFDISVSDWDLPFSATPDEAVIERQSHVFWKNPGAIGTPGAHQYFQNTDGYGGVILGDAPATNGGLTQ